MQIWGTNPVRALSMLALVVTGVALLCLACAPLPASTSSSAIATASSLPSITETAEPTPGLAVGWTISNFPNAQEGDQLERIVDLGELMFVIGSHAGQGGIWHSPDGITWQLATDLPTSNFELGSQVHGIARAEAGYAAVGANYVVDGAFPLIWSSPDGDRWTDVTPDPDKCLPLSAITGAGARFVAVGAACRYDEQTGPQQDGVSFTSSDGVQWDRSPLGSALVDIALGDVIWTGSEVVARGEHFGTWSGTLQSSDGLTWTRSPAGGAGDAGYIRRLAWADGRFTAVGGFIDSEGGQHSTVWSSRDLHEWDHRVVGAAGTQAVGIAFDGNEWVLIGGLIESDFSWSSFVEWRSSDGVNWGEPAEIISGASGFLSDVIATESGLIALGGLLTDDGVVRSSVPVILRFAR